MEEDDEADCHADERLAQEVHVVDAREDEAAYGPNEQEGAVAFREKRVGVDRVAA